MNEAEFDIELIRAYVEKRCTEAESAQVEQLIQTSREAYEAYLSLKEVAFLTQTGWSVSDEELSNLLSLVKGSQAHIRVRLSKNKIFVSQAAMESVDYNAIEASFPDDDGQTLGAITFERRVMDTPVRITLVPNSNRSSMRLSAEIMSEQTHAGILLKDGYELESLTNPGRRLEFITPLVSSGKYEIVFFNETAREKFRIGLIVDIG